MAALQDMTGRVFGRLTVEEKAPRPLGWDPGTTGAFWRCDCECGRKTVSSRNNLLAGIKKSCGHCTRRNRRGDEESQALATKFRSQGGALTRMGLAKLYGVSWNLVDRICRDYGIVPAEPMDRHRGKIAHAVGRRATVETAAVRPVVEIVRAQARREIAMAVDSAKRGAPRYKKGDLVW